MMKKSHDQQLVRMKTIVDSNDEDDMTSASSVTEDNDSDHSSKIVDLMRENERKMRNLSESYMNRFLSMGQQLQALPEPSNIVAIPSTMKGIMQKRSSGMELETISSAPSFPFFIETLRQLIMKEERKRGKTIVLNLTKINSVSFSII